jgi:FHA domain-containing protein
VLARFERLMEQAVEGSLRRVFPTSLQPIQLAKAAARAMEQAQVVGRHGPEVPNLYELHLAPADLRRFDGYTETLRDEVRAYLGDYARERGLRLVAPPRVELIEDPDVREGGVRAAARFDGLPARLQHEVDDAVAGTRQLRLADLAAARQQQRTTQPVRMRLRDASGLDLVLEPAMDVVRLGRAPDNDVVLGSKNVSRYHAQLRWVESGWLAYDLSSTNGTWLDGRRLATGAPALVCGGSQLRLGDHDMQVEEEAPSPGRRGRS